MSKKPVFARNVLAASLFVLATEAAPRAHAQEATTTGTASALFDDGVALMQRHQYPEACAKLLRSNELSPNGGTLFALAECYERNGQVASAWVTYNEAAIRARAAKRAEAEKSATDAAERLAPGVSRLVLQVPPANEVPGLTVTLDGRPVERPEWGVATPIDPGTHRIRASAAGRIGITRDIAFDPVAAQKVMLIPLLEPEPVAPAVADGPPRGRTQRIIGVATGGVGLVGVALGTVFGLQASSKNDAASGHCRTANLCDAEGLRLDSDGRDAATLSTVAFIAGGTLLAGGIVLVLTAPRGTSAPEPGGAASKTIPSTSTLAVRSTPGGGALTLGGTF